MPIRQKIIFWLVVAHAVLLVVGGLFYSALAISIPLKLSAFGHIIPSWSIGVFAILWGGRMLYRLYRLQLQTVY